MSAGDKRLLALAKMMAANARVDLLALDGTACCPDSAAYVEDFRCAGVDVLPSALLHDALMKTRYDAAFCEFYNVANFALRRFRTAEPHSPLVTDTVDVHFARRNSEDRVRHGSVTVHTSQRREANQQKESELYAYRKSDLVITVTKEDDELLQHEIPGLQSMLIPMIVSVSPRTDKPRAYELVFVGGFSHPPNADGILWFIREIWPTVHGALPDARLNIVGNRPPDEIIALGNNAGIKVTGYVPDVAPWLDGAAVSIAPLRFGAGMKGKVTEAMSFGVPVVTTTIGAQGFGAQDNQEMLIRDDAAGFAQACIRLLMAPDAAERIGRAGQKLVEQLCSPGAVAAQVTRMVEHMRERRKGPPAFLTRPIYSFCNHLRPK